MNESLSTPRPVSLLLVAAAGFAGGAVFFPALLEITPVMAAGPLLVSGLAGTALYLGLWLLAGSVLASRCGGMAAFISRSGAWFAVSLLPLILYFPYLVYRTRLEGDSVELPPLGTKTTATFLIIWSLMLLVILLRIGPGAAESRFVRWVERHPGKLLAGLIAAWLAVFIPLDILKDQFMQVTTVNSALFIESLGNVADERGTLFSNLLFGRGASVLAVHANIVMYLLLPFFWLWPDYRMLLVVSDLSLALAAVPMYLITRRRFTPAISLLLSAMLLLHPIYTAQPGRSDFSELRFMPLLFLTAFYLFEKKRFWSFALTTVLLMTIREDMGLFVAFFGLYALLCRRSLKWVLGPALWGLAWFFLMFKVVIPGWSPSSTAARAAIRYAGGVSEIVTRPFSSASHVGVTYGLFTSFGLGLPLLSATAIFALPAAAEILLQRQTSLVSFMSLPTVPILMVALVYGLKRLVTYLNEHRDYPTGMTTTAVSLIVFFISISTFHTWFNPGMYGPRYNFDAANEALGMIPGDAEVVLPEFALAYGKPDQKVRGFHQIEYQAEIEGDFQITEDYLLIDRRVPEDATGTRYYRGLRSVTEYIEDSDDFEMVYSKDDLQLYTRR